MANITTVPAGVSCIDVTAVGNRTSTQRFSVVAGQSSVLTLMGLPKIQEIAEAFVAAGKSQLPAAVIQNASLPEQQEVFGTVADIAQKAQTSGLGSPAIIVIGEVVRHRIASEEALAIAELLQPEAQRISL